MGLLTVEGCFGVLFKMKTKVNFEKEILKNMFLSAMFLS